MNSEFLVPQIIATSHFFKFTFFKTLVFLNRTRVIILVQVIVVQIIFNITTFSSLHWRRLTCISLLLLHYQIIFLCVIRIVNWLIWNINTKPTIGRFVTRIVAKILCLFFFITVTIHLTLSFFIDTTVLFVHFTYSFLLFPELILILIFFLQHLVNVSNRNYFIKLIIFFHLAVAQHKRCCVVCSDSLLSKLLEADHFIFYWKVVEYLVHDP